MVTGDGGRFRREVVSWGFRRGGGRENFGDLVERECWGGEWGRKDEVGGKISGIYAGP